MKDENEGEPYEEEGKEGQEKEKKKKKKKVIKGLVLERERVKSYAIGEKKRRKTDGHRDI